MKKIFIIFIVLGMSFDAFASTTTYDDGSTLQTTTYDDGSTLNVATDTEGNVTTSSTPSTENTNNPWASVTPAPTAWSSTNILNYGNNITDTDLRKWNVSMDTIPLVLVSIINVLLWVAGTISIVALIYYAVQMQINSGITGDSSWVDNAKRWMKWAILGFIVAILAWFIVIRFVEILSSMS